MYRYLFLTPVLFLAACAPSRGEADAKLAAACEASIKATFTDPKDTITVKSASYDFQKSYDDQRLRVVTLDAQYAYGTGEPDNRKYTCAYTEAWTMFSYAPEFYSLQKGDEQFGNIDGTVTGDADILVKITEANHKALK